jgi:hypothetical protein
MVLRAEHAHGSFSRSDTWNFMAAIGPDFRSGFVDPPAPSSNADGGRMIAHLMGLEPLGTRARWSGHVGRRATRRRDTLLRCRRFVGRTPGLTPPQPE